jgi:DNA-binding NtrC family response regulator
VDTRTQDDSASEHREVEERCGYVIVWSGSRPALVAHPLQGPLVIGRDLPGVAADDDRLSRRHAELEVTDGGISVSDLASRNGTFVDGKRVEQPCWAHAPTIIRTGKTIGILVRDITPYEQATVDVNANVVVGPILRRAWSAIERAARNGDGAMLLGESGVGKELAAQVFHAATGATNELIAVNCATIPAGLAERLLFGTRRGAFSGADRDADGFLVAADGGTIFLDEIAELDLIVQAKLLRVIETHEVTPLGDARSRKVNLRVVAATLRDLRAEVAARRFREDLYHRLGRPEIRLPVLRARLEEIPQLIDTTLAQVDRGLRPHVTLIEHCLLRPWPGNVRELIGEIRRAGVGVRDDNRVDVLLRDLAPNAGLPISSGEPRTTSAPPPPPAATPAPLPDAATIQRSLLEHHGNVTGAARALGLHRNQLRRFLARKDDD